MPLAFEIVAISATYTLSALFFFLAVPSADGSDGVRSTAVVALLTAAVYVLVLANSLWIALRLFNAFREHMPQTTVGFRWVFLPLDSSWFIFFIGLFGSIMAALTYATSKSTLIQTSFSPDGTPWQTFFFVVGVSFLSMLLTSLIVNLLRASQYLIFVWQKASLPVDLSCSGESLVRQINDQLGELTVLISRDEASIQELEWTTRYIDRIRSPFLCGPADVLSIDSQISIRAIYPAALSLWAEQVRARMHTDNIEWASRSDKFIEAGEEWRASFAPFISSCLEKANGNFESANEARLPNNVNVDALVASVVPERSISARILIYDYGVLSNEVVKAVIDFHAAVGIPLFYIPAPYLRTAERGDVLPPDREALWKEVLSMCEVYGRMQEARYSEGQHRWTGDGYERRYASLFPLWRQSDDDFIVVDDGAWVGYPVRSSGGRPRAPQEVDPLRYIQKFCLLLACPGVMLAAHAQKLALREGEIGGTAALARWYEDLGPVV